MADSARPRKGDLGPFKRVPPKQAKFGLCSEHEPYILSSGHALATCRCNPVADAAVAEVAGRCQKSIYPGICGNWLPCPDHGEAADG